MLRPWRSKGFGRFDESKHPRRGGKFAPKGGGGMAAPKATPSASRHNPDLDAFMAAHPSPPAKPPADIRAAGPDIFAEHGTEPARHPSAHNPAITYGHADDRDSDDAHFDRKIREAHAEVVTARRALKEAEQRGTDKDPEVRRLKRRLAAADRKVASAKARVQRATKPTAKPRASKPLPGLSTPWRPNLAERIQNRDVSGVAQEQRPAPIPLERIGGASPSTSGATQRGPSQPPALPHHRTQAAALDAARQVQPGDHASHQRAVQALDAHYAEGKRALQRMAQERHGDSPRAKRAYAQALGQWRQKISAARSKIDTLAGRGPPPVPRRPGQGPPPLADRGRIRPWVSMKSYGSAEPLTLADLDPMSVAWPWVVKAWRESDHPRGQPENAGEFGPGGGGSQKGDVPATNNPTRMPPAAIRKAVALARAKVAVVSIPTREAIAAAHAKMDEVGADRYEADIRGNSKDRAASRLRLLKEFGDGTTCPCVYCGIPLVDEDGPNLVTRDKIKTARQGGRYNHANLLPACLACNKRRSDTPIEKVKWAKGGSDASSGDDVPRRRPGDSSQANRGRVGKTPGAGAGVRANSGGRGASRSRDREADGQRKGIVRPWLTKSRDASGHEHAADGRFGSGSGTATRKPGPQYDRKPGGPGIDRKAETKARTLAARIGDVPAQLRHQVTSFVRGRFRRLEKRYGRKGAFAILGAAVLLLPMPVPGSSLIPVAMAECVLAMKRAVTKASETMPDDATVKREARKLVRELYAACGEEMPK